MHRYEVPHDHIFEVLGNGPGASIRALQIKIIEESNAKQETYQKPSWLPEQLCPQHRPLSPPCYRALTVMTRFETSNLLEERSPNKLHFSTQMKSYVKLNLELVYSRQLVPSRWLCVADHSSHLGFRNDRLLRRA